MAEAPRKQAEFDIDFNAELPANMQFFPVWWLAKHWHTSERHVLNLIESGELPVDVDLRAPGATRSMRRVPRKSVVEFLHRRTDHAEIEQAARKLNYNPASKRRSKPRAT